MVGTTTTRSDVGATQGERGTSTDRASSTISHSHHLDHVLLDPKSTVGKGGGGRGLTSYSKGIGNGHGKCLAQFDAHESQPPNAHPNPCPSQAKTRKGGGASSRETFKKGQYTTERNSNSNVASNGSFHNTCNVSSDSNSKENSRHGGSSHSMGNSSVSSINNSCVVHKIPTLSNYNIRHQNQYRDNQHHQHHQNANHQNQRHNYSGSNNNNNNNINSNNDDNNNYNENNNSSKSNNDSNNHRNNRNNNIATAVPNKIIITPSDVEICRKHSCRMHELCAGLLFDAELQVHLDAAAKAADQILYRNSSLL